MKKRWIILPLIFITLALFTIFYLYPSVIVPSRVSVAFVCEPKVFEEKYPTFVRSGEVRQILNKTTNETEIEIEIIIPKKSVIKHELCHVNQIERPIWFSPSCNHKIQKFLREAECYISEDLPDPIYKTLYTDF